ncbi:hypothetical protein BEH93_23410 [Streptomyces sp. 2R]|nr:hypothetical protein BEH93_23410 [Streptomyces sp. 2R]
MSGPLPVIAPHGDFEEDTLPPLEVRIRETAAAHGELILDASRITFADSTFLRLLLTTHQEADLRIANPSPAITRLISLIGADQVLRIHRTVEDAPTPDHRRQGDPPRGLPRRGVPGPRSGQPRSPEGAGRLPEGFSSSGDRSSSPVRLIMPRAASRPS